jgi:hypothetical protein
MDSSPSGFEKIAPYLKHPLVLVGFVLFLFFGIHRKLIESGIIPPLDQEGGNAVVQAILAYGFWIAFAVVVLGIGLQYVKSHKGTSAAGVSVTKGVGAGRDIHARDINIGDTQSTGEQGKQD